MTFLFSPLGRILMVLGIIGIVAAIVVTQHLMIGSLRDQLNSVQVQMQSLQQAKDDLARDIANVQRLQQTTDQRLNTIRLQAEQSQRTVENRNLVGDTKLIQKQVNQDTKSAFTRLEALSHDP